MIKLKSLSLTYLLFFCTLYLSAQTQQSDLKITGINYNPVVTAPLDGDNFEFLLVTNTSMQTASVANDSIKGIGFKFPANTIIQANETVMITRANDIYPSITLRRVLWEDGGKLSNKGEELTWAKEDDVTIVNQLEYDDKDLWPVAADGNGSYLKLTSNSSDNTDPANWAAVELPPVYACSANGGDADEDGVCADLDCNDNDPAISYEGDTCNDNDATTEFDEILEDCSCSGTPIINEDLNITGINYNPLVGEDQEGDDFEFLLITNFGATDLLVGGDSFSEGIDFTFPAGTIIAAGETVMLTKSLAAYPALDYTRYVWSTGNLSNKGEQLKLIKPNTGIVNDLEYDDKDLWPESTDGDGDYLKLKQPGLDNTIPSNWEAVPLSASLSTSNFDLESKVSLSPLPVSDVLHIDLKETYTTVDALIYDLTGKVLLEVTADSKNDVKVDMSSLSSGIYILKLDADNNQMVKKIIKK